jgi:hypothetical protein
VVAMSPVRNRGSMIDVLMDRANRTGYLLRRDALPLGVDDDVLRRLVRAGVICRIRQGAYSPSQLWKGMSVRERHTVRCRAVLDQYDDHVALSHVSQAVVDGAPDWGLDLSSVHLTHLSGAGRRVAGVVHHRGELRVGDLRRDGESWTTTPTRTVLDACGQLSTEAGMALTSWYLHEGLTTAELLDQRYAEMQRWPRMLSVRLMLRLADGKLESVGESRLLFLLWRAGLPRPELQWHVWDGDRLVGIVDFAWPQHGLMAEFDGMVKYGRLLAPGQTAQDVVVAEKLREDDLREVTGFRMIRPVWDDLERPTKTADRVGRLLFRTD